MTTPKKPPPIDSLSKLQPITKRTAKLVLDEGYAWSHILRHDWLSVLSFFLGIVLLVFFWEPIPPKVVGIAVGREGTSDGLYGEKLAAFFAEHGVELNITYTEGGKQPISVMQRDKSIQSALVLGGLHKKHELDSTVFSLGSSQFEPLWLFYRGADIGQDQPILHFATTSGLAIGEPGSGSHAIITSILRSDRHGTGTDYKLLDWPYLESVDALVTGKIQALSVVDGIDSPIIKKLLADPNIRIANFPLAPAYARRLPQLDLVTIPRGSFKSDPMFPAIDVNMVATSLTLVVDKTLHPALQLLFLMAMDHIGDSRDQFFAKQDEFPSYKDTNIPLAPIAKKYFTQGSPPALNYVGFVVASLVDRIWFFLLGIFAILYPIYQMTPNFRTTLGQLKTNDAQDMLHDIQVRIVTAENHAEFDAAMEDLARLQQEVDTWIPRMSVSHYYQIVRLFDYVKKIAGDRLEFLNQTQSKSSTE
jgi:hypothetical protein